MKRPDIEQLAREIGAKADGVARTVELLDAGNTLPFITRYRRDQTGGLDEQQIERVQQRVAAQRMLEQRRETILRSLEGQGKLTDELRKQINGANSIKRLDDLYLPFKPKKQSLAARAREGGLGPLAEEVLAAAESCADLNQRAAEFVNEEKGVADAEAALTGAGHIVAEQVAENAELRGRARKVLQKQGALVATRIDGVSEKKAQPFKDYFEYREPLAKAPAHRVLAINRGERAKVLRVSVACEGDEILRLANEATFTEEHPHAEFLRAAVADGVNRLLLPSLEREARRDLTDNAEAHSVSVFAQNLRNLLLQRPLAGKRVLAIDPGYKNGCKLAALDEFGGVLDVSLMHLVRGGKKQPAPAQASKKKKKEQPSEKPTEESTSEEPTSETPATAEEGPTPAQENEAPSVETVSQPVESSTPPQEEKPVAVAAEEIATASDAAAEEATAAGETPTDAAPQEASSDSDASSSAAPTPSPSPEGGGELHASNEGDAAETHAHSEADSETTAEPVAESKAEEAPTPQEAPAQEASQQAVKPDPLAAARKELVRLVTEHNLNLIALGNGKACRPCEELVASLLSDELKDRQLAYLIVNEAGASVYSTSSIGREELPNHDPMHRSAVSIGRRVQDPLSELVKIDPASIGVGLYQHDAKARPMRDTLDQVVQTCVSFVGVDVNSASAALLRYVSGLNQLTARRITEHRAEHGPFRCREQLMEVSGYGETAFVQSAGFLKIDDAENPLDATWVHPESYDTAAKLIEQLGLKMSTVKTPTGAAALKKVAESQDTNELAASVGVGRFTLDQLIDALGRPGRDPREDAPPPVFRHDVVKFEDLSEGMELRGTVLNVVDFGAFVDIGLSDSGLVHVSRMSHQFVRDPHALVAVGDQVRVWVASVDAERRRVALSMVEPGTEPPRPQRRGHGKPRRKPADAKEKEGDKKSDGKKPPCKSRGKSSDGGAAGKGGKRPPRRDKRRHDKPRRGASEPRTYEAKAGGPPPELTEEMKQGKEAMRTFGDLMQFVQKKDEGGSDESE